MIVTAAGVDTWSPSWYVDPEGPAARYFERAVTVRGPHGSELLVDAIAGHRVGWFKSGLVFAEGHPSDDGLCPGGGALLTAGLNLQEQLLAAGLPINARVRRLGNLGPTSEGWAGLRRADATANLEFEHPREGLAMLAAVAGMVRDAPGQAEVRFGRDRAVETVYLRGWEGKRVLGRWYDKGLEASIAKRGTMIRAEDQRRWAKGERRDVDELTGAALRAMFKRRFAPLYKVAKGVTVTGAIGVASKLVEAVEAGEMTEPRAAALMGGLMLEQVAGVTVAKRTTAFRRRAELRELGLMLADGVLEEVEVDVGELLEQVLETDAWERRG